MKNPQAFPKLNAEEQCSGEFLAIQEKGMTLLDYFAGQALSSMDWEEFSNKDLAKEVYDVAEAMLKERERRND